MSQGDQHQMPSTLPTRPESSSSHGETEKDADVLVEQQAPSLSHGDSTTVTTEGKLEKGLDDDWETDPDNPRNWSSARKWVIASIVSMYAFISPLASSMMAPGLPEVAKTYQITNSTILAMTLSIFLLSFAFGPLFLAPLSEMYGRTYLYNICNVLSIAFSIGCAYSPTVGALIAFRFLAGLSGSAAITCGGGSISDMYSERQRAYAMSMFSLGPLFGPAIGPVAGGYIAQTIGIKWVFIVIAIVCAVASIFGIPFLRETYAPVLRHRKAIASGDPEKIRQTKAALVQGTEGELAFLWMNLTRPATIFFTSFTCFILSLYLAFMAGIYYLMFVTFSSFFAKTYGFGPGVGGLAYLGLGVGFLLATFAGAKFSDLSYRYLADKRGKGTPEMRMPALFVGSFIVPIGLFWYGWSAEAKLHWMMPIVGSGIFAFGVMMTWLPILLYLVDAFEYAASATAAAYVLRSLLGFVFPLFGKQMFDRLGLGGGNSLLAGLVIVLGIPFPVWIYYRGEAIRLKSKLR
ncbi:multidrug resistance protein 4 [Lyophyllum atratum]|nr:multidrug resistance protein 4 [Lyophyllum atratum]